MTENDLIDLDNLDIDELGERDDLYETDENTKDSTDHPSKQSDPSDQSEKESLHKYKEVQRPKMCERKDFILVDLMCNNCNRIADLMIKMNKSTEALLSIDLDQISDEEYHKILHTADTINKMLVDLNSLI